MRFHCNLQYIGETKRRLKDRFNEYKLLVDKRNIKSKPTTVSEHFFSHSSSDYLINRQLVSFISQCFELRTKLISMNE